MELEDRVRAGCRDAFAEVAMRYRSQLIHYIRSLDSQSEPEDVLQESFLRAFKGHQKFRADGNLLSWLYKITWSTTIDFARRRHRRRLRLAQTIVVHDPHEGPEQIAECGDLIQELHRQLNGMSTVQKTAVRMAYLESRTYEEIAEALKIPVGTVKSRIHAGLRTLREVMNAGN